jgi:hypothetical protein
MGWNLESNISVAEAFFLELAGLCMQCEPCVRRTAHGARVIYEIRCTLRSGD